MVKANDLSSLESSETDLMLEGSNEDIQEPGPSLDDLFEQLSKQAKIRQHNQSNKSQFEHIEESLAKLPKLKSKMELNIETKERNNSSIIRLNDKIRVQGKQSKADDAGDKWFNMRAPELTEAVSRDLLVIKQRAALDPKRHYKRENWQTPKFFQMGTILEGDMDPSSSRIKRKSRGTTLVNEILNDDDTRKYFKRKYAEIQEARTISGKARFKKMRQRRRF